MRETVKDWQRDWLQTNGQTKGLEVLISDRSPGEFSPYIYEGSFADIDEKYLGKKVVEAGRIIDSSERERIGAYSLKI